MPDVGIGTAAHEEIDVGEDVVIWWRPGAVAIDERLAYMARRERRERRSIARDAELAWRVIALRHAAAGGRRRVIATAAAEGCRLLHHAEVLARAHLSGVALRGALDLVEASSRTALASRAHIANPLRLHRSVTAESAARAAVWRQQRAAAAALGRTRARLRVCVREGTRRRVLATRFACEAEEMFARRAVTADGCAALAGVYNAAVLGRQRAVVFTTERDKRGGIERAAAVEGRKLHRKIDGETRRVLARHEALRVVVASETRQRGQVAAAEAKHAVWMAKRFLEYPTARTDMDSHERAARLPHTAVEAAHAYRTCSSSPSPPAPTGPPSDDLPMRARPAADNGGHPTSADPAAPATATAPARDAIHSTTPPGDVATPPRDPPAPPGRGIFPGAAGGGRVAAMAAAAVVVTRGAVFAKVAAAAAAVAAVGVDDGDGTARAPAPTSVPAPSSAALVGARRVRHGAAVPRAEGASLRGAAAAAAAASGPPRVRRPAKRSGSGRPPAQGTVPLEVLERILRWLGFRGMAAVRGVCRGFCWSVDAAFRAAADSLHADMAMRTGCAAALTAVRRYLTGVRAVQRWWVATRTGLHRLALLATARGGCGRTVAGYTRALIEHRRRGRRAQKTVEGMFLARRTIFPSLVPPDARPAPALAIVSLPATECFVCELPADDDEPLVRCLCYRTIHPGCGYAPDKCFRVCRPLDVAAFTRTREVEPPCTDEVGFFEYRDGGL